MKLRKDSVAHVSTGAPYLGRVQNLIGNREERGILWDSHHQISYLLVKTQMFAD